MLEFLVILLAILICIWLVFGTFTIKMGNNDDIDGSSFALGFVNCFLMAGIVITAIHLFNQKPRAIDVYKNKTELKYNGTYINSVFVPTDSTVIYKKGCYKYE